MKGTIERNANAPLPTVEGSEPETLSLAERAPRHTQVVLGVLRIVIGFYFLWAFLDKTFGLGFSTPAERSWINGNSPTTGFLSNLEGTFSGFFSGLAGNAFIDVLFASVSGTLLLLLMYLAELPLVTNPIIDDHITMALTIIALTLLGAGSVLGLGKTWKKIPFVQRNAWLV